RGGDQDCVSARRGDGSRLPHRCSTTRDEQCGGTEASHETACRGASRGTRGLAGKLGHSRTEAHMLPFGLVFSNNLCPCHSRHTPPSVLHAFRLHSRTFCSKRISTCFGTLGDFTLCLTTAASSGRAQLPHTTPPIHTHMTLA